MKVETITNYHDRWKEALFDILNFRSEGGVHLQGISFVKTISLSYGQINVHIIVRRSKSISKVIYVSRQSRVLIPPQQRTHDICTRNHPTHCRSDISRASFSCGIKERTGKFSEPGTAYYCIVLAVSLDELYWRDFLCFPFHKTGMHLIERAYWS